MHLDFGIETTTIGAAAVVSLHGELDVLVAPAVEERIRLALATQPAALALDLRDLSFMDSTGVHALIATERHCRGLGIRFLLVRGSEAVDHLLALCGLEGRFEMISDPRQLAAPPSLAVAV